MARGPLKSTHYELVPQISAEEMFLDYCCDLCGSEDLLYQKILSSQKGSWHWRNNIVYTIKCKHCGRILAYVQTPKKVLVK